MQISAKDKQTLRQLAQRYSELAHLEVQQERIERYYQTNALEAVRPVVLISEVPWGEIRDQALVNTCAPELGWLETRLRCALYQWDHFQVDLVIPPLFEVGKQIRSSGIGLAIEEVLIKGDTGAYIAAHEYHDVLQTDEDLEKLHAPEISYNREGTEEAVAVAEEVFAGLLPVKAVGGQLQYSIWDQISQYRGVETLLYDLAVRPEFSHRLARRFTDIAADTFRQYRDLELLYPSPYLLHCTAACSRELPASDFAGQVRYQDVWGRCAAQIFGSVSPAMHDEFDLTYNQELFGECGLLYYGCCEPMDTKVDILRRRFKNLRKISVTPWAEPERAASEIGRDYVLAAKPNPAFVSSPTFDPVPVEKEITAYMEACRRHGTTCEFVLKDISTIANRSENLTQWAATVKGVIDRYWT
ncbi:MAG: hypothetical protein IT369_15830 [Candidatus Latescibacteria bacterium]|nr:hypothetical protein [Candidatus Latescibacterota bacterium]